ncbi:hypothetical protein SNE40_009779 [Patella caerulea]|uniref:CCHC-type domain-containing protein n=1 Tax=Patella caerulea TaxID=87958 RepID=A0AAN8PQQ6_PATCE
MDKDLNKMCNYKRLRECTVRIMSDVRQNVGNLIDEIEEITGFDSVIACVPMNGVYEVTLSSMDLLSRLMENELVIEGETLNVSYVGFRIMIVSFMNIPHYISDVEIIDKLKAWNVTPLSEIKERFYKHGERSIADGTRYVKVKFPPEVASLPYATRFDGRSFYVKHDNQARVCFNCLKSDHEVKNCPDSKCYRCQKLGHTRRNCSEKECETCGLFSCQCESNIQCKTCGYVSCQCNESTGVNDTQVKEVVIIESVNNDNEMINENTDTTIITPASECEADSVNVSNNDNKNSEVFDSNNPIDIEKTERYEAEGDNKDDEWRVSKSTFDYNKTLRKNYLKNYIGNKPASNLRLEQLTRRRESRYNLYHDQQSESPNKRPPSVSSQDLFTQHRGEVKSTVGLTRERRI